MKFSHMYHIIFHGKIHKLLFAVFSTFLIKVKWCEMMKFYFLPKSLICPTALPLSLYRYTLACHHCMYVCQSMSSLYVCMCVKVKVNKLLCVCVCVREGGREREERERGLTLSLPWVSVPLSAAAVPSVSPRSLDWTPPSVSPSAVSPPPPFVPHFSCAPVSSSWTASSPPLLTVRLVCSDHT